MAEDAGQSRLRRKVELGGILFGCLWALTKGLWGLMLLCLIVSIPLAGIPAILFWFHRGARGEIQHLPHLGNVGRKDLVAKFEGEILNPARIWRASPWKACLWRSIMISSCNINRGPLILEINVDL